MDGEGSEQKTKGAETRLEIEMRSEMLCNINELKFSGESIDAGS